MANETNKQLTKEQKANDPNRLPIGKFFAWKTRDISQAAVAIVMGFLTLFCTDFLGIEPAVLGTLLMASKIFDGVTDLLAGFLIDNTKTRFGKGRPYEFCVIGLWLCTLLLFFCRPEWAMAVKCAWVFIMYTFVYSIFITLTSTAQTPYMIRAFKSRIVIAKVSSYGGVVTMVFSIAVSVSFPILMARLATSSGGWRTLVSLYAVPLCLLGMLRFIFVKEDPSIDAAAVGQKLSMKQIFQMFKTNQYAWFYAIIIGFFNLIQGLNVAAYYFKYIVGNIALQGTLSVLTILMLPVMFFFPTLMKKMSVSKLIVLGAACAVVGYGILFFAGANMLLLLAGNILMGLAMLPLSYLGTIIIMNIATNNEYNGLPRMEGSVAAVSGFGAKVFGGIGTALVGLLLSASGYIASDANTTVTQPESALFMIRSAYSLIPLACMLIIIFFAFKLDKLEKEIPQIESELKARKENAGNIA
jgi:probable glucitol transport protein GutA